MGSRKRNGPDYVRRDNRGRRLKDGESQRPDGRYAYKYTDNQGKVHFAYSWRLVETDPVPKGKRHGEALRSMVARIQADLAEGILSAGSLTVADITGLHLDGRAGVRDATRRSYSYVMRILQKDPFGACRIDRVRVSDAKAWIVRLQREGRRYSTVRCIRNTVRAAFRMAVEDDLIRKNPFAFDLSAVLHNDCQAKKALGRDEEARFLEFVRQDNHYRRLYDAIYILLHTGLRISEFAGLTVSDIDMKTGVIRVRRQLLRVSGGGYMIEKTKSKSGRRDIPMSAGVKQCFARVIERGDEALRKIMIDGISGFLFFDRNGMPLVARHWQKYFVRICDKYNRTCEDSLPHITPHICRHTFCSRMAMLGMHPKILQYIMGHSDIRITFAVYTHYDPDIAIEEILRIYAMNELGIEGQTALPDSSFL